MCLDLQFEYQLLPVPTQTAQLILEMSGTSEPKEDVIYTLLHLITNKCLKHVLLVNPLLELTPPETTKRTSPVTLTEISL